MPKAQTKATMKYEASQGIIAKSFKMKRELAENFKDACAKDGVSQASKIAELLQGYIDEVNSR